MVEIGINTSLSETELSVCKNLKLFRLKFNLHQEDVAEVLKVSRSTYGYYETGKRIINITSLKLLAEFYNTSVDTLLSADINATQNTATYFNTFVKSSTGFYKAWDKQKKIQNKFFSYFHVEIDEFTKKIFESTSNFINDKEYLFEYDGNIYISKIIKFNDGTFFFYDECNQITKKKAEDFENLFLIGILHSTIMSEYKNEDLF